MMRKPHKLLLLTAAGIGIGGPAILGHHTLDITLDNSPTHLPPVFFIILPVLFLLELWCMYVISKEEGYYRKLTWMHITGSCIACIGTVFLSRGGPFYGTAQSWLLLLGMGAQLCYLVNGITGFFKRLY